MTTIRQLVTDALRESNVVASDESPTANELDEGVRRMNTMIRSLFGRELGEPLQSVNYGTFGITNAYGLTEDMFADISAVYVPLNVRLIVNATGTATLSLHPNPSDGARLGIVDNAGNLATYNIAVNGNGRKIEGSSTIVLSTNSLNREWFFRADLGQWTRVTDLTADSVSPFPSEFDDLLSTMLAYRLNPRFGAETSESLTSVLNRARSMFSARYSQTSEQIVELGLFKLTGYKRYTRF